MKTKLILLLASLVVGAGCKKEEIPVLTNGKILWSEPTNIPAKTFKDSK